MMRQRSALLLADSSLQIAAEKLRTHSKAFPVVLSVPVPHHARHAQRRTQFPATRLEIETGNENPTLGSVTRIARALRVDVADLLREPAERAA